MLFYFHFEQRMETRNQNFLIILVSNRSDFIFHKILFTMGCTYHTLTEIEQFWTLILKFILKISEKKVEGKKVYFKVKSSHRPFNYWLIETTKGNNPFCREKQLVVLADWIGRMFQKLRNMRAAGSCLMQLSVNSYLEYLAVDGKQRRRRVMQRASKLCRYSVADLRCFELMKSVGRFPGNHFLMFFFDTILLLFCENWSRRKRWRGWLWLICWPFRIPLSAGRSASWKIILRSFQQIFNSLFMLGRGRGGTGFQCWVFLRREVG